MDKEREDIVVKSKSPSGKFGICVEEIQDLVKTYNERNFDEDVQAIKEHGGTEGLASKLHVNLEQGLNAEDQGDVDERVRIFDINTRFSPELPPFCVFVADSLNDRMLQVLIVAAVVQIVLGVIPSVAENPAKDWVEGFALCIAITIVVSVGSIINYRKEKQFKELNDSDKNKTDFTVRRRGILVKVPDESLMAGDVCKISIGNIIPGDGVLLSANTMKVDESALTGESDQVEKDIMEKCFELRDVTLSKNEGKEVKDKHAIPSPVVISGSQVTEGEGWFLVLAVGRYSEKGKIQLQIIQNQEDDDSKTPLELKLDIIAEDIGWFGVGSAVLTMIALGIRLGINESDKPEKLEGETDEGSSLVNKIMKIILLCVAIVVVAIPEGMPLAVTLSLAFSVRKMMDEKNLVRKMHSCETMGNANFICSDKTGTLTQNVMTINYLFDGVNSLDFRQLMNAQAGSMKPNDFFKSTSYYEELKVNTVLNLQMEISNEGEIVNASNTDMAFIKMFKSLSEDMVHIRKSYFPGDLNEIRKFPFNSDRKKMTTILRNSLFPKENCRVMMKGAAEIVLRSCSHYVDPETGSKEPMSEQKRSEIQKQIQDYCNMALRGIVVAYKDINDQQYESWQETDETGANLIEKSDFTFMCVAAIKDILREGVENSVSKCHRAGINVVMITGDNYDTACAIARECGIMSETDSKETCALEGKTFFERIGGVICVTCNLDVKSCKCPRTEKHAAQMGTPSAKLRKEKVKNMDEFDKIVSSLKVIARSRVDDKYALILGLRHRNNIVSVTGDGTNDAKALSRSDVGFAMGIMGTEIAKDAADIIILDDNFNSIVNAVKWGRNIYDNIQKFIVFQLTVNIASVILVFVTAAVGNETPIEAIQMLWLNLIMDSLGSLSLATEPPHERLLERHPYPKSSSIISTKMWKHILIQSTGVFLACFIIYLVGFKFIPEHNDHRRAEGLLIWNCYGEYPGHGESSPFFDDPIKILAGSEINWSSSVRRTGSPAECGHFYPYGNLLSALEHYKKENGSTIHMTFIFNLFVYWSLLNQVNARVIDDNLNVFYLISKNKFFLLIMVAECGAQALFVSFGGSFFKVDTEGLTWQQWLICLGLAMLTYPLALITKLIPMDGCFKYLIDTSSKILSKLSCSKKAKVDSEKIEYGDDNTDNPQMVGDKESERQLQQKKSSRGNLSLINNLRGGRKLTVRQSNKHL